MDNEFHRRMAGHAMWERMQRQAMLERRMLEDLLFYGKYGPVIDVEFRVKEDEPKPLALPPGEKTDD